MNIKEKAKNLSKSIIINKPFEVFNILDESTQGMKSVLLYLNEVKNKVSAGELSKKLKVSTARIAILIKKLLKNSYINKENDKKDARITIVSITEKGKEFIKKEKEKMINLVEELIKKIGIEDLETFLTISLKIKNVTNNL